LNPSFEDKVLQALKGLEMNTQAPFTYTIHCQAENPSESTS